MWNKNWRNEIWADIQRPWDMIIIGGGITGAGILREATRLGMKVLLVEQRDFAWGTSSRSSKLVHGGLRYLKKGKIRLTRDSVREREQLLRDGPGLIKPLDFLLATYDGEHPGRVVFGAGLTIYDLLALQWSHRYYSAQEFKLMAGQLTPEGLEGGFRYGDAQTEDARLVLRVIREAVAGGAAAINYVKAVELLEDAEESVTGVRLQDQVTGHTADIQAQVVINATGAWADRLRALPDKEEKIRPLRGSHLVFPSWRVPVAQAVSFLHPLDQRPVFLLPWEEVTLIGTTDDDYGGALDDEPAITGEEVAYLMAAVEARYPGLHISLDDVLSTFAGIRPVIGSGKGKPSEESRDHKIWKESGLITVTGGKLTTFRLIARDVLDELRKQLPDLPDVDLDRPIFDVPDELAADHFPLDEDALNRLQGRYGTDAAALMKTSNPGELEEIPGTNILWAELRWAARSEGVVHLDDLLLRRVRLGIVAENGGLAQGERIRSICQQELGWDDEQWQHEMERYEQIWNRCYSLPARSKIPDWRRLLAIGDTTPPVTVRKQHALRTRMGMLPVSMMVFLTSIVLYFSWRFLRGKDKYA